MPVFSGPLVAKDADAVLGNTKDGSGLEGTGWHGGISADRPMSTAVSGRSDR
jgi:hypothetical protein